MLRSGAAEKFPAGVFLPIIWAHPPVEYAHRSITQAGDDERTLGVAGKAGHTAVCSRRDVLVPTHPPKKRKSSETKPSEVPRSLHHSFHAKPSWKSSIMRSVDCWLIPGWSRHQYAATGEAEMLVSVLSPSIKAVISRPSTIRCVKTEKTEETAVPQRISTSLPKQPRFSAGNTAHTEALSSRM